MKSIVLIISLIMSNGEQVQSPAFYMDTKEECVTRGAKILNDWNYLPDIRSMKFTCHEVVPEVPETK